MARIINNSEVTFSPSVQQVINNAAANVGVDIVYASIDAHDRDKRECFDLYDEDSNYLFSVDINAGIVYSK